MDAIKNCSVFGHSEIEITTELESRLSKVFEDLIIKGCENFYFGGFGAFDDLCHKVVSNLKEKYLHIKRIYCLTDARHLRISKRPKWLKNEVYEDFIYLDLEFDWWYQRIYFRNLAMMDLSDVIVFYVQNKSGSGAFKAYQYAIKNKKNIINLFEK